jgi:N-methylhydantoinase B
LQLPGGGGFFDPFTRNPADVLADVESGFVSPERARADYGVALTPDNRSVDSPATAALRGARC